MSRLVFNPKYEPLFLPGSKDSPRYKVVTGGRGSGKSTAVSTAKVVDTYRDDYTTLYSRYTLVSAEVSVIPEYLARVVSLGKARHFRSTKEAVINRVSNGKIYFRGILASSGNQTARLKSIPRLKSFLLDEAQELTSESEFDTIDLSIREKDVVNDVELVLNPSDIHHWIYKRFFKKPGVPFDYNGRVGDVQYIHTDWRDNRENLHPSFIAKALECERENPDKYQNIYLGDWAVKRNGLIYPRWESTTLDLIPLGLDWWYGNDWGYSGDPDALVRMAFDPLTRTLYVVEVLYSTGKLPRDVAAAIRRDCADRGADADDAVVYCDPARPDSIAELRTQYGINALPGINRDKVGRIGYLQGFKVRYVGKNIQAEAETYSWEPSKEDEDVFTDTPQDGGDHCFVGSTLITTIKGEKRIDEITENDLVLTSNGYKRVITNFYNGYKKIREYSIKFRNFEVVLQATPDHKIKTSKGWKQLQELCETDELYLSKSLMERNTTSTQVSDISADTINGCTGSSGNTTTARSRKDATSTTRTEIQRTTKSTTSNLLSARPTSQSTPGNGSKKTLNLSAGICTRQWKQQRPGINPKKERNGTGNTQGSKDSEGAKRLNIPAIIAAQHSEIQGGTTSTTSVPQSVHLPGEGQTVWMMSPGSANGAERNSERTNTNRNDSAPLPVQECIVEVHSRNERIERVFDICVEGMHEYFANGILVHNCMDSISYGTTHLRRMGIPNDDGDLPK